MTNRRFSKLFGVPPRKPEADITEREMDLAASIQAVCEEIILKMVRQVYKETGLKKLCLAGGVALNCVANGRILRESDFEEIWIQPAAGDAGGAVGAALSVWHHYLGNNRPDPESAFHLRSPYMGPAFSNEVIKAYLEKSGYPFVELDPESRAGTVAARIAAGKVVGYLAGRMEFGPRALGARSILGDARSEKIQKVMNLKIKFRESFRPFAPSVLAEKASDYFDVNTESPYMLLTANVRKDRQLPQPSGKGIPMLERLKVKRSDVPAVTHLDYSARLQTVSKKDKRDYYEVISEIDKLTGCPVIVNTSFNVRGEPIVCTPEDAYRCFMRTEMDVLIMEDCMLLKEDQPTWEEARNWRETLELD
jgi:carbamoyltransferase